MDWIVYVPTRSSSTGRLLVGSVSGNPCVVELVPGLHGVFLKVDWCRSEKIEVSLKDDDSMRFCCGPRSNLLTIFYWCTFGYSRYIWLTQ